MSNINLTKFFTCGRTIFFDPLEQLSIVSLLALIHFSEISKILYLFVICELAVAGATSEAEILTSEWTNYCENIF